ncbi:MAG: transglycosylase SLT domain-containing protein [Phycisphaerales bacterium]|nr:transglycosylase SLT domain-containing protein [Phycisphaerales bacterium]
MNRRCMLTTVLGFLVLAFAADAASAYYNPRAGRWLNRDPIGENGGNNIYAFVNNTPVNSIDPLGEKVCERPTGSLRFLMVRLANKYNFYTKSGKPDQEHRINADLLGCIACIESSFKPCAVNEKTNDFGLMQLSAKKTGGIKQCQAWGILPKKIDFSDKHKKKCCGWDKQPRFKIIGVGAGRRVYRAIAKEKECAKGCEKSIWNVEKQIECAAALLRQRRDRVKGKMTLAQIICQYNRGIIPDDDAARSDHPCSTDSKARKQKYTQEILECLQNLGKVPPQKPPVPQPPGSR